MEEQVNPSDRENEIAYALAMTIMANCVEASTSLDRLYSKLRIGGGLLWGSKMSAEVAKSTRYELIAYNTALTRALLEAWQAPTVGINGVLKALEAMAFSMDLAKARQTYESYVARYL